MNGENRRKIELWNEYNDILEDLAILRDKVVEAMAIDKRTKERVKGRITNIINRIDWFVNKAGIFN